jgi:hypothetical protein
VPVASKSRLTPHDGDDLQLLGRAEDTRPDVLSFRRHRSDPALPKDKSIAITGPITEDVAAAKTTPTATRSRRRASRAGRWVRGGTITAGHTVMVIVGATAAGKGTKPR